MNFSEAVAISASSLWAHKLRSILTLIGVVIGVAAVIAVVSLINGANQYVATRVFRLGADVFGLSKQPSIITNVDDWLAFQKRISLPILVEKDKPLLNIYSVMEVNPANGPRVNVAGGKAFADFMVAAETQSVIKDFGVDKYGQPLFVPIAGKTDGDFQ